MRRTRPSIVLLRRAGTQVFLTRTHLCIVMELAPGGDMYDYIGKKKRLQDDEARHIFRQLIAGLDYCHRMASDVCP